MLKLRLGGIEWRFSLLFPAAVVVLLTLDGSGTAAWCLAASAMHEGGHFLALLLCGGRPSVVAAGVFGVRIEQDGRARLSYTRNLLVSLAGPAVNLLSAAILALTGGWTVPAVVHGTMAAMNLLPIEPLDGGQALLCLLAPHFEEQTVSRVLLVASIVTILPLAAAGFTVLLRSGYNFTLLAVCLYLSLLLLLKRK